MLCGFGQNFLLAAVEVLRIPAPLGWGVALAKVLLFLYFFVGGRLDSTFKWTFCTKPGVWEVHDNVHVLALLIHLAQVYAVGLERREESAFC